MIAMKKTALLTCALALCLPLAAQAKPVPAIAAAIADTARPEADKARDGARKPAEMLAFAGIKPGAKVGELLPGAGYFTRVIAKTVGDKGAVYVWMAASAPAAWVARLDPLRSMSSGPPRTITISTTPAATPPPPTPPPLPR
jgi:predicted methyltransferase